MQDLTQAICNSITGTNTTGQLVDKRDDKIYWVTKLKDNNCWMVQNLDYDGGGAQRLELSAWSGTNANSNIAEYYDPGDYYFTRANSPASWSACADTNIGLSSCIDSGWSTSGDNHYHAGNYYSWEAANSNICPAGWQLPTSNSTTKSGSFGKLVSGLGSGATWVSNIVNKPYYFLPGGSVVSSGKLYGAGASGNYWSSTFSNANSAYNLAFGSSYVSPSSGWDRYGGYSIRCLVLGS